MAQGVPASLGHRIFLTFGTRRVVCRQPYAPAAFTLVLIFRGRVVFTGDLRKKSLVRVASGFFAKYKWTVEASGANRHRGIKPGCTLSTGVRRVKHDAITQSLIGMGKRQVACLAWPIVMVPKRRQTKTNNPCDGLKNTAAEACIIADFSVL